MFRTPIAFATLVACAGLVACSSPSKPMCGGPRDAGVIEVGLEAPPGCPPSGPNELSDATHCTLCGDKCAVPLRCTCDPYLGVQLEGVPCVCTKVQPAPTGSTDPCTDVGAGFCGSNATCCNVLTTAAYCVPDVCLIN